MDLTLGPILFDWKKSEVFAFYDTIAKTSVDRVYIGEVVCVKKLGLSLEDMLSIGRMLEASGKAVTYSTLAVVSNEDEIAHTRAIVEAAQSIEANDMSAISFAEGSDKEIIAGPHITSYNAPTVDFLKSVGASRIVFPVELPRDAMAHIIKHTDVVGEVFGHGKLPLAFSWRCYTSRASGLTKTECKHDCLKYPDGMELKSLDGRAIFTANGTSILSADTHTLIEFVEDLSEIGVEAMRISPQYKGTEKVVEIYRARIDHSMNAKDALAALKVVTPGNFCNGWYKGEAGMSYTEAHGI